MSYITNTAGTVGVKEAAEINYTENWIFHILLFPKSNKIALSIIIVR